MIISFLLNINHIDYLIMYFIFIKDELYLLYNHYFLFF